MKPKSQYYNIYSSGQKIGEGYFTPDVVKKMESHGYRLRLMGKWGHDKKEPVKQNPNMEMVGDWRISKDNHGYYAMRVRGARRGIGFMSPSFKLKKDLVDWINENRSAGLNPKKLTRKKARTILHHGTVRKHPLTLKQRKFFGARASGAPRKNPKGLVLIYKHVTRIEGTKGRNSAFPGQRFFHNFKRPYPSMYGTPDKKTLVIK